MARPLTRSGSRRNPKTTFLESEGPHEPAVRSAAASLGLDYSAARFGSVDEIYKTEVGRDILTEPTLLFNDVPQHQDSRRSESFYARSPSHFPA
ncbi:hypothetical protein ACFYT3_19820 [Nocardia amikacinitolerans]|uniref:hypothetical protein n=1 Tax=Nocardia amikacinitolerans TaxID=756689 RepID=UPI0036A06C64